MAKVAGWLSAAATATLSPCSVTMSRLTWCRLEAGSGRMLLSTILTVAAMVSPSCTLSLVSSSTLCTPATATRRLAWRRADRQRSTRASAARPVDTGVTSTAARAAL